MARPDLSMSAAAAAEPTFRREESVAETQLKDLSLAVFRRAILGGGERRTRQQKPRGRRRRAAAAAAGDGQRQGMRGLVVLDDTSSLGLAAQFCARAGARAAAVRVRSRAEAAAVARAWADNGFAPSALAVAVADGGDDGDDGDDRVAEAVSSLHDGGGDARVDVLLSNWLGDHCLFSRSRFPLFARLRDRLLRADSGLIYPDKVSLNICAIQDFEGREDHVEFWRRKLYRSNLSAMKERALAEPVSGVVSSQQVATSSARLIDLCLYTLTAGDVADSSATTADFRLEVLRSSFGGGVRDRVHAFAVHLTAEMPAIDSGGNGGDSGDDGRQAAAPRCAVSNSPLLSGWRKYCNSVFYIDSPLKVDLGDSIQGFFSLSFSDASQLQGGVVKIGYRQMGADGTVVAEGCGEYSLM